MSMTKHNYNLIAEGINNTLRFYRDTEAPAMERGAEQAAYDVAELLEANNDNFDRAVFLAKCGIKI